MTGIIVKLDSAKTLSEINRIVHENGKHFSNCSMLYSIAWTAMTRVKNQRIRYNKHIFNN
jgi:hypothetical protein